MDQRLSSCITITTHLPIGGLTSSADWRTSWTPGYCGWASCVWRERWSCAGRGGRAGARSPAWRCSHPPGAQAKAACPAWADASASCEPSTAQTSSPSQSGLSATVRKVLCKKQRLLQSFLESLQELRKNKTPEKSACWRGKLFSRLFNVFDAIRLNVYHRWCNLLFLCSSLSSPDFIRDFKQMQMITVIRTDVC